jgi:hypothetical protein
MALKSVSEELLPAWDEWSQQSAKYKPGVCDYKWQSFREKGVTLGTLYYFARLDLTRATGQRDNKLLSSSHNEGGFESLQSANAPRHLNLIGYKNMATTTRERKSSKTIEAIDTEALAEYSTDNYHEKLYGTVYYTIRELQGLSAKRSLGDTFSWDELKERFESVFGKVEERRFSLEQLLEYANRKFGKSLEQLLEINDKSWERRREWKAKAAHQSMNDMADLPEF